MVHPGRFELPTARFVAKFSIQLSYGCIGVVLILLRKILRGRMVHPGRFELPTARFVAEYSIQLSYGCKGVMLIFYFGKYVEKEWCTQEDSNFRPLGS